MRLSVDRDGLSTSPQRQMEDAKRLCAGKGWEVAQIYEDRDVSAYTGKHRPQFKQLLADVEAGALDALVVWKLDRLTRSVAELARTITFLEDHNCSLASVNDPVDTSTPMGKAMVQIAGVFAELESATIGTRVRRAQQQAAEQGKWHSGGHRTFGYERDGTVVESEAALVREAASRIIGGESMWAVCNDWASRGAKTTVGNDWRTSSLSQLLRSPTLTGYRNYNGTTYEGEWEAILDLETFGQVNAQLDKGRSMTARRTTRKLLTGLILCGICGGKLNRRVFTMQNGKKFERYQCVKEPGKANCGKIAASMLATDEFVTAEVLGRYTQISSDVTSELQHGRIKELQAAFDDDASSLESLTRERYVDRAIDDVLYLQLRGELAERIAATQYELDNLQMNAEKRAGVPTDALELANWWESEETTVVDKRKAIEGLVSEIVVNPAKRRGGNKFDTNRVKIAWK